MTQRQITDDLDALFGILPEEVTQAINKINNNSDLLEIILDLGRVPSARLLSGEEILSDNEVTRADIDYVVEHLGVFDAESIAGVQPFTHFPQPTHKSSTIRYS